MSGQVVLSGPVTGVIELDGVSKVTGKPWSIRKAVVLIGRYTQEVLLTRDVPTPGEGEMVAYEVGVKIRRNQDRSLVFDTQGNPVLDWTAYKVITETAPVRAVS